MESISASLIRTSSSASRNCPICNLAVRSDGKFLEASCNSSPDRQSQRPTSPNPCDGRAPTSCRSCLNRHRGLCPSRDEGDGYSAVGSAPPKNTSQSRSLPMFVIQLAASVTEAEHSFPPASISGTSTSRFSAVHPAMIDPERPEPHTTKSKLNNVLTALLRSPFAFWDTGGFPAGHDVSAIATLQHQEIESWKFEVVRRLRPIDRTGAHSISAWQTLQRERWRASFA